MSGRSLVTIRSRGSADELLSSQEFLSLDYEQQKDRLNRMLMAGQTSMPAIIEILLRNQRPLKFPSAIDDILTVYIIGAGPVGLLTAIKLIDAYKTKIRVVIFDKRAIYSRERVLFITKRILSEVIPKQLKTKSKLSEYGCGLGRGNLPSDDRGDCIVSDDLGNIDNLAISTRVLEDDLKHLLTSEDYEYASQASLIINEDSGIEYMEDYIRNNPCHVLIGADAGNISTKLFGSNITKIEPETTDNDGMKPASSESYGLIIQFIPENSDPHSNSGNLHHRQHRYRAFRQQYKNYTKCNSQSDIDNGTCTEEPLSYYMAVQITPAERDHIVQNDMDDQEWLTTYTLGNAGPRGKYLDRLIYDGSRIYNFGLKPGRVMNGVSVFKLGASLIHADNYSRIVTIDDVRGQSRNIWFPLIGDSVVSVNFFSGSGLNVGFAMIEFIGKALAHVLPFNNTNDVFSDEIRDPYDLPGGFESYSPAVVQQQAKATDMFPDILPLDREYTKNELAVFQNPNKLRILVDIYKKGIIDDLRPGVFMTENTKGILRIVGVNIWGIYLDYVNMIENCRSDPKLLNTLKRQVAESGVEMELVDLDDVDGLYTKADDRLCLMSHNTIDSIE